MLSSRDNIEAVVRDHSLDTLLLLDGDTFVVEGNFWVKFEVKQVPVTPEKPHGLDYSLTLHDGDGKRLLGFDNAHSVRESTGPELEPGSNTTTSIKTSVFVSMSTKMR